MYIGFPTVVGLLIVVQQRARGADPPVTRPMPRMVVAALGTQGTLMMATGLGLFAKPLRMSASWPWPLTPLTARTIAAWFLALGFAAFLAIFERDLARLRPAAITYLAFAFLQYTALLRFRDDVRWENGWTWVYVTWLASVAAVGIYGVLARTRMRSRTGEIDLTGERADPRAPTRTAAGSRSRVRSRR